VKHERVAALGVPLPDDDYRARDHITRTLPGIADCPQRDGCMLEVRDLINGMRKEFSEELRETRGEVKALRTVLDNWVGSKGIRNTDSTPTQAPNSTAEIKTDKWRVRAPVWAALALAVLLVIALAIWQIEEIAKLLV
jgi:hypothetical protein